MTDEEVFTKLGTLKDEIVQFIKDQLLHFQPRDDYKELLHLSLLFLGEDVEGTVHINAPGAYH